MPLGGAAGFERVPQGQGEFGELDPGLSATFVECGGQVAGQRFRAGCGFTTQFIGALSLHGEAPVDAATEVVAQRDAGPGGFIAQRGFDPLQFGGETIKMGRGHRRVECRGAADYQDQQEGAGENEQDEDRDEHNGRCRDRGSVTRRAGVRASVRGSGR